MLLQKKDIAMLQVNNERAIRTIVSTCVEAYASGFSDRHISELNDDKGTINLKINNVFIAALGPEIQYYSAMARSLDSSLGNMIEKMAIQIAKLHYDVRQHVEGSLYKEQTDYIAELLEKYKRHAKNPMRNDYCNITERKGEVIQRRHESDYYLIDEEIGTHYLIELKTGGDLDVKKARSEKEALLEQYCILANEIGNEKDIKILFATAYNKFGEGKPWRQSQVRQYFAEEELCISKSFWNLVCKSESGYDIVIDEYKKNSKLIRKALDDIKESYLPNEQ